MRSARFVVSCCALFIFSCAVSLSAQQLRITGGVVDDQVLQRGLGDHAVAAIEGSADSAEGRDVEARVLRKHVLVPGFDWTVIGKISQGKWRGEIRDLPIGGPYRIELRLAAARTQPARSRRQPKATPVSSGPGQPIAINGVLVGDLWILAGQSNMEGVANLANAEQPHEMVHSFDMADQWVTAEEPLHTLPSAVDRVHWRLNAQKQLERLEGEALRQYIAARKKGAGLGLPFAVEMVRRTGVPIGLIPCAHGGTSMTQWDPALREKGGDSLYGSMLRRFHTVGAKVKGVLWYQGESDTNPKAAPVFQQKFERFVSAVRDDFNQPDLPFYWVQIGRYVNNSGITEWNGVQEMQRKSESTIKRSGMVAAVDLALDDGIHVGTEDQKRLGHRLAKIACHDLFPENKSCAGFQRGPHPLAAEFENNVVRVVFSDVNGRLTCEGRVSGFSIHSNSDEFLPVIFDQRIDPAGNAVLLYVNGKLPEGATVHYGYGKDPYCNVRDEADMAVPVFGPLPISASSTK